jgi:hypothetical protein
MALVAFILHLATGACILRDWSDTKAKNYWPPNTQRYSEFMLVAINAIKGLPHGRFWAFTS